MIMLNDITMIKKVGLFHIDEKTVLPYERRDKVWVSVSLEMNLNVM